MPTSTTTTTTTTGGRVLFLPGENDLVWSPDWRTTVGGITGTRLFLGHEESPNSFKHCQCQSRSVPKGSLCRGHVHAVHCPYGDSNNNSAADGGSATPRSTTTTESPSKSPTTVVLPTITVKTTTTMRPTETPTAQSGTTTNRPLFVGDQKTGDGVDDESDDKEDGNTNTWKVFLTFCSC